MEPVHASFKYVLVWYENQTILILNHMSEIPCAGRNKIISDSVEFHIALLGTLRQLTGEMKIK